MALREEEKWWIEERLEEIVQHLKPRETIMRLRERFPNIVDEEDVDNVLLKYKTPREQTIAVVDLLKTRPREGLVAFREVISVTSPALGSLLWPAGYRILWFSPTPRDAAMVVHLLQQYSDISFHPVEDGGLGHLVRRSSGGVFGDDSALLTLAFPTRPELFQQMLKEMCREEKKIDLVILTSHCEAMGTEIPAGQSVVPHSFKDGETTISCRTAERIKHLQTTLNGRVKEAIWQTERTKMYDKEAYMNYCSVWLARLYIELNRSRERGQRSDWIERQGIKVKEKGGMVCQIPEWETGELAGYVLNQRRTWHIDSTSQLGIAPNPTLLTHVTQKIDKFNSFPTPPQSTPPSGVVFNPLTTGGEGVLSMEANQFFQTCSTELASEDTEWLASLAVCYDHTSDTLHLSSHTSVTMAMDIVHMLMDIRK